MARKFIPLGMVVAAFAVFALPAAANPPFTLIYNGGSVKVDAGLVATSTNAVTTNTPFGNLACSHLEVPLVVTSNSGDHVAAAGNPGPTTTCYADSIPIEVTRPTLTALTTAGEHKGTLAATFIADVGPFECHYEGGGTFTYGTGFEEDEIHISGIPLSSIEICEPEDGSPVFEADFTMTTEATGEQVAIQEEL